MELSEDVLIKFTVLLDQVSNTLSDLGYKKANVLPGEETLVMTPKEAMKVLNVGQNSMYCDLLLREDFPSFRIGDKWYINKKGLQNWIDNQSKNK